MPGAATSGTDAGVARGTQDSSHDRVTFAERTAAITGIALAEAGVLEEQIRSRAATLGLGEDFDHVGAANLLLTLTNALAMLAEAKSGSAKLSSGTSSSR